MSNLQAIGLITLVFSTICAYTDYRDKKIYNGVTFPMLAVGLIYHFVAAGREGLTASGAGVLIVMPLFIFFALGMLGAGDIKLFMALGSWYGKEDILWVMLYSLAAGGVHSLVLMLRRGNLKVRFEYLWDYLFGAFLTKKISVYQSLANAQTATFRFAPAIAIGALMFLLIGKAP